MSGAHRVALLRELTQQVAYQLWVERGRPVGSPEDDCFEQRSCSIISDRFGCRKGLTSNGARDGLGLSPAANGASESRVRYDRSIPTGNTFLAYF